MSLLELRRAGDLAIVTLDNPPVNALSAAVRQGLLDLADRIDADPSLRAVVLICAGRTFVAGADVREFDQPPIPPHLPQVIDRIEAARAPWIAAIHGTALGGGFELAMGCRWRIALAGARIGLPEVTLGLVPGAGGTVRTPRLAGVSAAVDLVTGGRPLSAAQAQGSGLLDAVVETDLEAAACAFARNALAHPLPSPVSQRPLAPMPDSFWQAAAQALGPGGPEAPRRALNCLRHATEHGFAAAMAHERQSFLDLRGAQEAAALRHVFFAERAARTPAALRDLPPRPLAHVGVIGGGTMGAGIAAACCIAGLRVTLIERDGAALARGLDRVRRALDSAARRTPDPERAAAWHAALTGSTDPQALAPADLVIEAVFEDLATKRAVFADLGRICPVGTVLATNTSYLDPRLIAEGLPHPERFLGLHFFSPAQIMKLLEIVPLPQTAPDVQATAWALARRLNKIGVQAGICDGFIGNRILKRYRAEAEALLREGVDLAAIDAAMRAYGMRMGPFEAQDLGGLDIAFQQRESARARGLPTPETLCDLLVRAGRKGQKTGGGWYDYAQGSRSPRPSARVAELLAGHVGAQQVGAGADIAARLVGAMAAEGQAIVDQGIACSPADVDLVQIHGYGFPRWKGGPMFATGQTARRRPG